MPSAIEALALSATDENRYWHEEEISRDRMSPTFSSSSGSSAVPPSPSSTSSPPPPQSPKDSNTESEGKEKCRSRSRKPYRMASSFELSDEQPENVQIRRPRNKGDTYEALFGPSAPKFMMNRRSVSAAPTSERYRRTRKPLPVNPLTGEKLGSRGALNIPPPDVVTHVPNFKRFRRPPPGGFATQLW